MFEVIGLCAGYGPLPILTDLTLGLIKGETLVLLGRNGVGKTTLLKALIGIVPATAGQIRLNGQDITSWPPHRRAQAGIAYVPQGRGVFPKLTVAENLAIGLRSRTDGRRTIPADTLDLFPILRDRMAQLGGTLSGGQQQQLALARALCGAPDLLLLDEPSEGIQPSIVQDIGSLIQTLNRDRGITVLLVEQNLALARAAGTRCLVMRKGCIAGTLSQDDLRDETRVFEALAL
jgi:urea ABC transporter ATP-binding protein UrtE